MATADDDERRFFRDARRDLAGPLDGLRVLEVATTWSGPRCGALLADFGADVVKIESPHSPEVGRRVPPILHTADPPTSFLDASVNRNKRNASIDLHAEEGRSLFLALARQTDIVVENLRVGTMTTWGCGYEQVRAVKPDIIYVSITGYGQFGPYSRRAAYDPGAQALSGFMWLNTTGANPPMKAPVFLADELAALHATMAALAAIRHRDRTGEGQHIDVSLLDAMVASSTGLPTQAAQGLPPERMGNTYTVGAPTNAFLCRDGWVYAGVLLDAHWQRLAVLLGVPHLATHPDYATIPARIARREELDGMLGAWCAERTREEVVQGFASQGLTAAAVLTPTEMLADPHVQARQTMAVSRQPSGRELTIDAPAARMSRTPLGIRRAAPALGADTDAVLDEAGIEAARRAALRQQGIIQ